jgi:hypothetical protein
MSAGATARPSVPGGPSAGTIPNSIEIISTVPVGRPQRYYVERWMQYTQPLCNAPGRPVAVRGDNSRYRVRLGTFVSIASHTRASIAGHVPGSPDAVPGGAPMPSRAPLAQMIGPDTRRSVQDHPVTRHTIFLADL